MSDMIASLAAARRQFQPGLVEISSAANPRLRQLRALLESARERRRSGQTVLDGWHLLDAWLQQGRAVQQLVLPRRTLNRLEQAPSPLPPAAQPPGARSGSRNGHPRAPDDANPARGAASVPPGPVPGILSGTGTGTGTGTGAAAGSPPIAASASAGLATARWLVLDDGLFDALDILPSPVPVLALVDAPAPALPERLAGADVVILDRVQDPGNVGAIIRTAAAAGIRTLLATTGTAACWSPKVLRAGMGGHFVLDIHEGIAPDALPALLAVPLAGTVLDGGQPLYGQDLRPPLAWIFGNEGEGIDPHLLPRLGLRLTIPQASGVESLNVAAAAAVCLFEQRRQRLAAPLPHMA